MLNLHYSFHLVCCCSKEWPALNTKSSGTMICFVLFAIECSNAGACQECPLCPSSHLFVHLFSAWREGSCSAASRPEGTRPSPREVGSDVLFKSIIYVTEGLPQCLCWMCPSEVSEIMHDIGSAIEYLHHVDIAHRDVKVGLVSEKVPSWNITEEFIFRFNF